MGSSRRGEQRGYRTAAWTARASHQFSEPATAKELTIFMLGSNYQVLAGRASFSYCGILTLSVAVLIAPSISTFFNSYSLGTEKAASTTVTNSGKRQAANQPLQKMDE